MAEIASGIQSSDPVQLTAFQDFPDWLYAIESEPCQQEGLLYVRVTVQADQPAQKYPLKFSLSRWIVDPAKELDANNQSTSATSSGSQSGAASSGGASSGGSKP